VVGTALESTAPSFSHRFTASFQLFFVTGSIFLITVRISSGTVSCGHSSLQYSASAKSGASAGSAGFFSGFAFDGGD
jgi:hypothetical protein